MGGRVVLTAGHCFPPGFAIPQPCDDDADCPDISELGGAITLECNPESNECRATDPLASSYVAHAQFGSQYTTRFDFDGDLPRKTIQVLYCRKVAIVPDSIGGDVDDFAYCLLSDEPNLQAIPISVPCENEAELLTGTTVVAVGFGQSAYIIDEDTGGTKRWATATLQNDAWSSATALLAGGGLDWTTEGGLSSSLAQGDSGGPLFAQMSDGSWRVIGTAQTGFQWGIPFHHIEWLLADPNIEVSDILPCHDATGAFVGGASCTESPTAPDVPSGQWARGSNACHTESTTPLANLCAAMAHHEVEPDDFVQPSASDPPRAEEEPTSEQRGCRVGGHGPPGGILAMIMMMLLRRRTQ